MNNNLNAGGQKKLHLGCGSKYIPGFTHIDIINFPHIDIQSSVDKLPMFEDSSIDLIYACHVLEHFGRKDYKNVLAEWCRILKKGGTLRVTVPDFDALVEVYRETGDLNLILGPIIGGQTYVYNFHYMVFNEKILTQALLEAGFSTVGKYSWRDVEHADVDDYSQAYIPHMDKENGRLISLNIEAVK